MQYLLLASIYRTGRLNVKPRAGQGARMQEALYRKGVRAFFFAGLFLGGTGSMPPG